MNEQEMALPKLSIRSLRTAAYTAIREAILSGLLKPGERLVEVNLARQLGVSRAPVREALRQLETEGLVVTQPHRGTYVAEFSAHDLWEIYTLRAAVEGLAVHLVASDPSTEVVERLEDLVDRMRRAAQEGDRDRLSQLDMRFHETICKAAQHQRLLEAWQGMYAQIQMFISITGHHKISPDQLVAYHEEVLNAIRSRDPERAEALLKDHILTVGERIVATLKATESSSVENR